MNKDFSVIEEELSVLFARLNFYQRNPFDILLKEYQLTDVTYNILRILRGAGEGGLPCAEISKRMLSRVPDVTRLIDRLVKLEYVERNRKDGDRRVVIQTLTPKGLEIVNKIDEPLLEICRNNFANLSEKERKDLLTLMTKLLQNPFYYEE